MGYEAEADEGLGLNEFLTYDPDRDKIGGGTFLRGWKEKGQIDVWLHVLSKIHAVWGHQFIVEDEVEKKDDNGQKTGHTELILRWPRFVSPDPGNIHSNQYFREKDTGILQQYTLKDRHGKDILDSETRRPMVMSDPFLLLREYVRHAVKVGHFNNDTVIFEWVDHKKQGALIQWKAGEISELVKRGKLNRGHSLNTKLEYIFTVIENDKPDKPLVSRETKLLGDKMRETIRQQIESRGVEEGDPFRHPYCFRWVFDKNAKSPMDSYKAFRIDKHQCTDAIWEAIGGPENSEPPPDTSQYARVNDGDADKIRAGFEAAAQVELPLDDIFSLDGEVRRRVITGEIFRGAARRAPQAPPQSERRVQSPAERTVLASEATTGVRRTVQQPTKAAAPAQAPAPSGPQPRRKKVEKPAEPPPVPTFPCEECGTILPVTCALCPKCGAEYEIDEEPQASAPKPEPAKPTAPASEGRAKRPERGEAAPAGETAPAATSSRGKATRPTPDAAFEEQASKIASCFACGSGSDRFERSDDGTLKCGNCGVDVGDDIPFDVAPVVLGPTTGATTKFWSHVAKQTDGCWLWTASVGSHGYGNAFDGKKVRTAHRWSFEIHVGPIPMGKFVCHRCDQRRCVNPEHLYLGTHRENMNDTIVRRRHSARYGVSQRAIWLILRGLSHREISTEPVLVSASAP